MKPLLVMLLPFLVVISGHTVAQTAGQQAGRNDGAAFGNQFLSTTQTAPRSQSSTAEVPGYAGTDLPETQYQGGEMYDAAVGEAATDEAAQLLSNSFQKRPKIDVRRTDPWLQSALNAEKDPYAIVDQFTGKYDDCVEVGGGSSSGPAEYKSCMVWDALDQNACSVGRQIDMRHDMSYACTVGKGYVTETCGIKTIATVIPGTKFECEPGAVLNMTVYNEYFSSCRSNGNGCSVGQYVTEWTHKCGSDGLSINVLAPLTYGGGINQTYDPNSATPGVVSVYSGSRYQSVPTITCAKSGDQMTCSPTSFSANDTSGVGSGMYTYTHTWGIESTSGAFTLGKKPKAIVTYDDQCTDLQSLAEAG
jgi:hypothetical protein